MKNCEFSAGFPYPHPLFLLFWFSALKELEKDVLDTCRKFCVNSSCWALPLLTIYKVCLFFKKKYSLFCCVCVHTYAHVCTDHACPHSAAWKLDRLEWPRSPQPKRSQFYSGKQCWSKLLRCVIKCEVLTRPTRPTWAELTIHEFDSLASNG